MSLMNVFILCCFYCIVPIQYLILRNESKPKKNIVLGATLSYEARKSEEAAEIVTRFRRRESILLIVLTAAALPALLFPYFSGLLIYMSVWLIPALLLPYVPFAKGNRALRALKKSEGQRAAVISGDAVVDLKGATLPKKGVPTWAFVFPAAVSAIPMVWTMAGGRGTVDDWGVLLGCGSVTVCIALFIPIYRLIFRQRMDVVGSNTDLNAALTRIRRQYWGRMFLWTSWLTAILNLFLWLTIDNIAILIAATILYMGVLLAAVLYHELKMRDLQARLTAQSGQGELVDEDRYWLWGLLYCNPNDRHIMVNQRVGGNMTVNVGRTAGKVIMAASVLVFLLLPLLGVWMMSEERTPVTLYLTENTLVAEHTGVEYEVPLEEITSVELLETLPPCRRQVGTGMENLLKGRFSIEGGTRAELCLNPQSPPFLRVETPQGVYLFGAGDRTATEAAYAALTAS